MIDKKRNASPAAGFKFEYAGNNEYRMTLQTKATSLSAMVPLHKAPAMISLLMMELAHSQTPEAEKALQMFALHDVTAKSLPDGTPYREYNLENGSGFATGIPLRGLRELHRALGDVLGKVQ